MTCLHRLFRNTLIVVGLYAALWAQDSGSATIRGHIRGQVTASLIARLYSPKSSFEQSQQKAQQSSPEARRVRVSFITADGTFEFPGLRPGSYLLEIYNGGQLLYQKVVSTEAAQPLDISLDTTPAVFSKSGWHPIDMTAAESGVFVLDNAGIISRLSRDQKRVNIDSIFELEGAYNGVAITASSDSVYAVANSKLGCTLFRYPVAEKASTKKAGRELLGASDQCGGVATDGTTVYVSFPQKNEIRLYNPWNSHSARSWSVTGVEDLGPLAFDRAGKRLIAAGHTGKASAISTTDGSEQVLSSDLGWVNAISTTSEHLLFASGTKILSLARSDNHGEKTPPSLESLTGGHIVGIAVDENGYVWFADYDRGLAKGPIGVN